MQSTIKPPKQRTRKPRPTETEADLRRLARAWIAELLAEGEWYRGTTTGQTSETPNR